ncbi:MurR/RpiR family transcriptional regulator [Spiroplasma chrysopicola]|uniref:RpiR family transcriptional regulator n=1 Tax=Spiroplasma chrysopicola DF-1 TaxID=1276227 RepID=R4UBU4_9MOLU|nr:SIS domain-containing protein [Spiroplasma chrysopicola]AGM25394.1 hypothetical protein SCHRY_v1c08180 [Spiroplasma chrysopicola DF-1]
MVSNNDVFLDLSMLAGRELDFYYFTINNYDFLINSNLQTLSQKYGVGMSFIYGFFKKLNVSGLKEYIFKLGILHGVSLITKKNDKNSCNSQVLTLIQDNYQVSNNINVVMFQDQQAKFDQLITILSQAKIIYAFGAGHSLIALTDLCGMLTHFGLVTQILERGKNITKTVLSMTKNDVLIIFSMRGLNDFHLQLLKLFRREQIPGQVVLITSNLNSELNKYTNLSIFIDNQIRRINDLEDNLIFSPLWSFLFFTDYLKNLFYIKNKKLIDEKDSFLQEMNSWHDNKRIEK